MENTHAGMNVSKHGEDVVTPGANASKNSTARTPAAEDSEASTPAAAEQPSPASTPTAAEQPSPTPSSSLLKRVAVITGASSGLGLEFALQLDRLQVADEFWLISRDEDQLVEVAAKLDTPALPLAMDLTSPTEIAGLRGLLHENQPRITFLVNAAGFGKFGDWQTISDSAIDAMIDLNCRALVDITHACLPYMEQGSRIIQIASAAAFTPLPHMNVYAATKSFVLHYTRALRWELHGTGITCTALCPTWVKTGFEKVARTSSGGHDVGHLWGEQTPQEVVHRCLCANKAHFAVSCASPQSAALRLASKILPSGLTMAAWNALRKW
jgi:short-subunit dehydrogenase